MKITVVIFVIAIMVCTMIQKSEQQNNRPRFDAGFNVGFDAGFDADLIPFPGLGNIPGIRGKSNGFNPSWFGNDKRDPPKFGGLRGSNIIPGIPEILGRPNRSSRPDGRGLIDILSRPGWLNRPGEFDWFNRFGGCGCRGHDRPGKPSSRLPTSETTMTMPITTSSGSNDVTTSSGSNDVTTRADYSITTVASTVPTYTTS